MMKKFILAALMLIGITGVKAQQPQMTPLPLNPAVKHGVLPNGLSYYILHNEEPKNRANFYIAQKVGSTLETPEQLGLAHFLEHMAFNGTKNYPGHNLLTYLESKGIRFGADINAYTGFDETVYNIDNIPCNDIALMDSVLLILHDWSGSILLEEDEIDAERGVIEGEYISRNDASTRMYNFILPKVYEEYQYEQLPIGKMEIVKNFPPDVLRAYYKKWYRPDLQGIVIVGDFDADLMEQKVISLFSDIEMPANAAPRTYANISDNDNPIYVTFEDAELQMKRIDVSFKYEKTPKEIRNTVESYIYDDLLNNLVANLINNRLNEFAQNADCPYAVAVMSVGDFYVSKQKGAVNIVIIPKDDIESAFTGAMQVITQACKAGFMPMEVERVRDNMLSNYEKLYNERDKTRTEGLARELIRHFIDNEPSPGIETEYDIAQQVLPTIPVDVLNQLASNLLHPDNQVIVISQPETEGLSIPEENTIVTAMNNILNADYQPYVDEEITDPLIAKLPVAGDIISEIYNEVIDGKEILLSNGVRVLLKNTDFSNDQIILAASSSRGKRTYPESEAANIFGLNNILDMAQIGPFNTVRLPKYLAGKQVSLNYGVGNTSDVFVGTSTVRDLNTLFELLYASFTDVSADQQAFDSSVAQGKSLYANQEKSPEFVFSKDVSEIIYSGNKLMEQETSATFEQMNYGRILELYHQAVQNAADYTFVLVGNLDEVKVKEFLKQYVATLPSVGKAMDIPVITPINVAQGQVMKEFNIEAKSPAVYVRDCISQDGTPFTIENMVNITLLSNITENLFLASLREEMGGTYSPDVTANFEPYENVWIINWDIVTNADQQQAIRDRAMSEFTNLLNNGASAEHFNKVKEAAMVQYENNVRTNTYWLNNIINYIKGFNLITGHKDAISNLTLKDFNNYIKKLYNGKNRIEVVGFAK